MIPDVLSSHVSNKFCPSGNYLNATNNHAAPTPGCLTYVVDARGREDEDGRSFDRHEETGRSSIRTNALLPKAKRQAP